MATTHTGSSWAMAPLALALSSISPPRATRTLPLALPGSCSCCRVLCTLSATPCAVMFGCLAVTVMARSWL